MKDELQKLWTAETPARLTNEERDMTMETAQRTVAALDRRLRWREYREILPAILVSAMFGAAFANSDTMLAKGGALTIIAGCAWIVYYMLRHGRGPENPSPAMPLSEYRAGIAAKFDHQIGLLRRVKYWYVLPLYLGMVLFTASDIERNDWVVRPFVWRFLGGATAFCGFTIWLNEVWAVRRLRQERDGILAMFEDDEGIPLRR